MAFAGLKDVADALSDSAEIKRKEKAPAVRFMVLPCLRLVCGHRVRGSIPGEFSPRMLPFGL